MIIKITDKLTSLPLWQLLLAAIIASELLTLIFSAIFSFLLWGEILDEVLVIGMLDAFFVAFILVFLTTVVVKRIRVAEITNKRLRDEIEERKRTEAANLKLEKQLRHAMKMEAIGTLAGGIAHDFNNILTAILGYSEIAKEKLPPDNAIRSDLDIVMEAGHRAAELVQQILTFSRQGEEDFHPLKVQHIVKEVLKLLRSSLPTTIELKESIEGDTGLILADPTQIHQVLMNICTNARQAIGDESGVLSVQLSETVVTDSEPVHECPQIIPGRYLEITISDTGCGIEQAVVSKIFDPFFTTKEKGKGTGLGLSVVHGIIKQHRGEITVHSRPGQETVFCIYLPVIEDELADEYAVGEDIPRGSGQRILFVDDEPAIADLMKQKLENIGYRVTAFTSSVEALNAYRGNPDGFDVLITDLTMPKMTGMELSRILIAEQADLPIILCTGYSEAINEEKARSLGIFTYLKKPVDTLTFAKAIQKALQTS